MTTTRRTSRAFGLTARLAVSYLLVALIVLVSAGIASYSLLAQHLWQAEEQSSTARAEAATLLAGQIWRLDPTKQAVDVAAEVQQAIPGVWAVALGPDFKPLSHPPAGLSLTADGQHTVFKPEVAGPLADFATRLAGNSSPSVIAIAPPGAVKLRQVGGGATLTVTDSYYVRIIPYVTPGGSRVALVARTLLEAGALALVVALLMAFWLSRKLTQPLHRLAAATGRLAAGEWETPLPTTDLAEVNDLSGALQTMAVRLRDEFQQLRGDREELKRLTAETAHEIKTPIASLRAFFELLLDGEQENPASRPRLLQRGLAQVERLQYLADFLVDMARLQAHAATLDMEEVDLTALVRQEVEAWQMSSPERGVALAVRIPTAPVPMLASRHRVGQALGNLIGNALQWSPPGGTVTVAVDASQPGTVDAGGNGAGRDGGEQQPPTVRISVTDEGPGIPPAIMPRLFTPFARGEGSTGLGLGLAVVQAVAASHGGRVEVKSEPGHGACLTLVLPR
ncbi:MAG: sensor histidine kinase [Symbiobacteriia bacterium]